MNVRKLVFIIVLIFTIPLFVGCQFFVGQNLSDSSLSEDLYDELVRYTIFNYEWLDEENIIVQMCHSTTNAEMIPADQPFVKTFSYNVLTETSTLLFEGGTGISQGMENIVFGDEYMYVYDETECQVFKYDVFENLYDFREEARNTFGHGISISVNPDGLCVSRLPTGDIAVFPMGHMSQFEIVVSTPELLSVEGNNGMADQHKDGMRESWYTKPLWSEDGNNITFLEIETLTENVTICLVDKENVVKYSYAFPTASNYTLTKDSQYMIGICEPMWGEDQKEIRIYDVRGGDYKQFLFEGLINGINVDKIQIADTHGNMIAVICTILGGKNVACPILLLNWETGEMEWLTEMQYLSYNAVFSHSGEELLVYGRNPTTESKSGSRFSMIEIDN